MATAVRKDVPVLMRAIGSVQGLQTVLVRARVDGTLDHVYFTEGQTVKAGDLLAQIDPRPYQAALDQVTAKKAADTAQLQSAQRDLARTSNLVRSDFASRQTLDQQTATAQQYQANLQGDDAAIATARLNLEFTRITSPIDGRVGLRMVDPGNLIRAADAQGIVSIAQIQPIAATFTLPQDALPAVQEASRGGKLPVLAYTADDKTKLAEGQLLTVDNAIDQATGTIRLKATFANAENRLWPGQFVNIRLRLATLPGALTIPSAAVQRGPAGLFVYLVGPDQTVAVQPVSVDQDDGETAVVGRGLDDGAQVVVAGQSRLQNGARVARISPTGPGAGPAQGADKGS